MPLFEFEGIAVTSSEAELTWLDDVERFETLALTIENTGDNALTTFKIYTQSHPNSSQADAATASDDYTAATTLIPGINGNPYTLASAASSHLLINCKGHHKIALWASSSSGTELTLRGNLQ